MFNIGKARAEIEERNRVRAEAQLPLLSVPQELRKLCELQRQTEFEEFFRASPLRQRIEQKVLNRMRRLRGDSQWKPTWLDGGLLFYARTRRVMGLLANAAALSR